MVWYSIIWHGVMWYGMILHGMAFILFVCLFVRGLSSHSRIFHSYADVTITGEGLQILTYARHQFFVIV